MRKDEKEKIHNKKEEMKEKYNGKGTRARLNTAAEKMMFGRRSK